MKNKYLCMFLCVAVLVFSSTTVIHATPHLPNIDVSASQYATYSSYLDSFISEISKREQHNSLSNYKILSIYPLYSAQDNTTISAIIYDVACQNGNCYYFIIDYYNCTVSEYAPCSSPYAEFSFDLFSEVKFLYSPLNYFALVEYGDTVSTNIVNCITGEIASPAEIDTISNETFSDAVSNVIMSEKQIAKRNAHASFNNIEPSSSTVTSYYPDYLTISGVPAYIQTSEYKKTQSRRPPFYFAKFWQ